MPLSEYQLGRCLKVMDKLKRRKISELFIKPLDQVCDNLPADYSQKIIKMIDLTIIRENLVNGIYNTVYDWKKDINVLWENCFNIFMNNDPQYLIAKELQETFNKLSELISDNPASDWESKLIILKDNFSTLSKNGPTSIFGDNGVSTPLDSSSGSSTSSKKKSTSRNKKKQPTNSADQTPEPATLGKSIPASYQPIESNEQAQPSSNTLLESQQNVSSDIDTTQLQNDIQNISDDQDLIEMANIIKQNEPLYQNNEDELFEVDLQLLSDKTLKLLRNYIDTLLKEKNTNASGN